MKFSLSYLSAALFAGAAGAASTLAVAQTEPQVPARSAVEVDLSLILDGVYYNRISRGNENPAGFGGSHGHFHDHDHGHSHGFDEGFNMGHSEIAMNARLGDVLDGTLIIGFNEDDFELEEAFLTTRALPAGLQLKGGKFLSDIGYINSRHPHDWDFVDRPLVNEYLFGDHGLREKGVQISWVPATEQYTRLGLEILQGETSGVANYEGGQSALGGTRRILSDSSGPRLVTGFLKFAPNLAASHAAQFGVSGGYARTYQETDSHSTRYEDWDGSAWFAGLDAVYKFDAGRSYGAGDWRLAAEYFYRELDLDRRDVNFVDDARGPVGFVRNEQSFRNRHDGAYVQAVYGFAPRWEAGLRAEALGLTNRIGRGNGTDYDASYRYGAQVTFRPVEPVFIRAQVNRTDFAEESHGHGDHDGHGSHRGLEFMLQVNVALGAHAAHRF